MTTYFVSDVHLGPDTFARTERFLRFVEQRVVAQHADLVVVGDLFDWWYGLPGEVPRDVRRVADVLSRARSALLIEGNHDVHIGRAFGDASSIAHTADAVDLELGGRTLHVAHGDLVDRSQRGYLAFRALLRGPPGRIAARTLGTRVTRAIGSLAARRSRHVQGGVDGHDGLSDGWLSAARDYAAEREALVILGHGHWLGWWSEGLICLGDWFAHDSYLRVDDDGAMGLWGFRPEGDVLLREGPAGAVPRRSAL